MSEPMIPPEIAEFYEHDFDESARIRDGSAALELVRTQEIIRRHLPPGPLRVLDVGGATGIHARWLAQDGHDVELVDLMPFHVAAAGALAAEGLSVRARVGDARALPDDDAAFDAVLLCGPLYHLTERSDRLGAWREALRVVKPGGLVFAASVNRFASLFESLTRESLADPEFRAIVERDLRDGQHRNPNRRRSWFTTAYFHHPDELSAEAEEAGARVVEIVGVEGLASWLPELDAKWDDPATRGAILDAARLVESEPTLRGLSAHLLLVARRRAE